MTLPTPPRYVVLPEEVIEQAYAPDKPRRALLASFTRILSLAWENKYQQTPAMNEDELMDFLKLSRRQYFDQKADMELLGWLRSSHPRPGFVQFTFSRAIIDKLTVQELSAENRTTDAENRTPLIGGGVNPESLDSNSDSFTPPLKTDASAENRTDFPGVSTILRWTPLLFDGAVVISSGLDDCDPIDVLAWCLYAYSQKSRLSGPGGVVRTRLQKKEKPPEWTQLQWREKLPEEFLEALGLIEFHCGECEQKFTKRAELEAHVRDAHPVLFLCEICGEKLPDQNKLIEHEAEQHPLLEIGPDESVQVAINGGMSAEQAWQSVLGQLQMEMPRASYDMWVRRTKAVRYDGNALQIGVRNAYARDWLESRLQSTVERLLIGILRQNVDVEFVVAEEVNA